MESKCNRFGINKNTYDLLFNQKNCHDRRKKDCSKEIMTIENYFKHQTKLRDILFVWLVKLIEMYYLEINYFHIRKKLLQPGYVYQDNNIKFEFDKLEKYLSEILKEENPYIKKELKRDMRQNLIKGVCYQNSLIIASNIENSYLVTSFVSFEDGTTYLHSYVEYDGYAIDYTKNLIVKKEVYNQLLKFEEVGKIPAKDISYIYNLLKDNQILNTLVYLVTFGPEIARDLEKNKRLLKKVSRDKANFSNLFW